MSLEEKKRVFIAGGILTVILTGMLAWSISQEAPGLILSPSERLQVQAQDGDHG